MEHEVNGAYLNSHLYPCIKPIVLGREGVC